MIIEKNDLQTPFFSICIPQYSRFQHLKEAIRQLAAQKFQDFEVCISDDCSLEGRYQEIITLLDDLGLSYRYEIQKRNLRYDANLRAAISLARGMYCFLHGNDDRLSGSKALLEIYDVIKSASEAPGAILTNYREIETKKEYRRISKTGFLGRGAETAIIHYRNFSFITGVILKRKMCIELMTDRWDGSEMYQMYLGCAIVASGRTLIGVSDCYVAKDIVVPGKSVESYANKDITDSGKIKERLLPMRYIGSLVYAAVADYLTESQKNQAVRQIFLQLYNYTYPFWYLEYRRVHGWKYTFGIVLGVRPNICLDGIATSWCNIIAMNVLFFFGAVAGMLLPTCFLGKAYPYLYKLAKSRGNQA